MKRGLRKRARNVRLRIWRVFPRVHNCHGLGAADSQLLAAATLASAFKLRRCSPLQSRPSVLRLGYVFARQAPVCRIGELQQIVALFER